LQFISNNCGLILIYPYSSYVIGTSRTLNFWNVLIPPNSVLFRLNWDASLIPTCTLHHHRCSALRQVPGTHSLHFFLPSALLFIFTNEHIQERYAGLTPRGWDTKVGSPLPLPISSSFPSSLIFINFLLKNYKFFLCLTIFI